ncbi:hypothetical protein DDZ18_07845 [Marinicauda salina]|jgi:uncharacterized FlaG/YvyC family protein|uniref:Flagellar protein FlaG n=1 Tax=Marinicauda salina TaxID=2135793 RepID=A0A2U2BUD8_9PROT|nr:flagellar protein FlaG [Marinicauda salina]PWE17574.1 hypothetical protein DDZ18_07845 [Marinicauda salina]
MAIEQLGARQTYVERPKPVGEVEPVHRATANQRRETEEGGTPPADPGRVREQIEAIEELRMEFEALPQSRLQIEREDESGRFVYRFLDQETGEIVRQWPPEDYLELMNYLRSLQGGLLNEQV